MSLAGDYQAAMNAPARKTAAATAKDREATKRRLIEAVGRVLAKQGFRAVGVNTVAREAGVDKVLIYRYFDGLPGLVAAFARKADFWPSADELCGGDRQAFAALPFADRMSLAARNYLRGLRARPLAREILAWRFKEKNELTDALDTVRAEAGLAVLALADDGLERPDVDLPALRVLLGAAINHLAVREGREPTFASLPLDDPATWERVEAMLDKVIRAVLGE
jgi:AcrR family transcriptional regulator